MNYGRIQRGPMAADAFTQIRNALFRDPRLSFKDKGVFGLISTHRDGYGVTLESIAACSTDGVSAVKAALRNLEKHGYLQRSRVRNTNGTLGASVYFITDQPEAFEGSPEVQDPRSEPRVENPLVDNPLVAEPPVVQPPVGEPPVADHLHKKTNSNKTSGKKTLSPPSVPDPRPVPAPAVPERETTAAPEGHTPSGSEPPQNPAAEAERIVAAYAATLGRPVLNGTKAKLERQAVELLAQGLPETWLCDRARELAARGWSDLVQHAERSTAPIEAHDQSGSGRPGLPPACPACLAWHPAAQHNPRLRTPDGKPFPDCHPTARAA